ncbi:hypothetical protein [Neptunitalea lumnitzerae]|uniref:Uncharacterized protein n=1 Tax=Neptunitalea lumnitzerae TaxID=2965509 RepID=A0ABQ5MGP8_9FLAO|nr:hypothetical protein [Neptunitalea sp. Y10]GLB48573.1 hypothetical protein Y10_09410 [Neptunitalea sp. Y10]
MTLEDIKQHISQWNEVRTTNQALPLLTQGISFSITEDQFLIWEALQPETLNCYLAVEDSKIFFYITDSVTDKNESYTPGTNLIKKNLFREVSEETPIALSLIENAVDEISATEAKTRILNWVLFAESWFTEIKDKATEIPRAISIPFVDLKEAFSKDVTNVTIILALNKYNEEAYKGYNMDLIVVSNSPFNTVDDTNQSFIAFYDVCRPKPPFGQSGLNLLDS